MDKRCATCGKQLQPDQAFCDNCGTAWTPAAAAAPAAAPYPIAAASPPVAQLQAAAAQTGGGRSSKLLLVAAIAIVALAIGGWFFLRARTAADSSAVPPAATAERSASSSTAVSTTTTTSAPAQPGSTVARGPVVPAPGDTTPTASHDTPSAIAAATEAAAGSKPCSLVTRAEMETILGLKIVSLKIVTLTTYEQTCSYFSDATMSVDVDTTWTGGKDAFAQVKGFNSAPGLFEPVAGIGDQAYMQAAGVLHVLKGDTYVVVNSRVYPNPLETESAIARKVMEKLR